MTASDDGKGGKTRIVPRKRAASAPPVKRKPCGAAASSGDRGDERTRIYPGRRKSAPDSAPKPSAAAPTGENKTVIADVPGAADGAPVVGWLVVIDGPGKGSFRGIFDGMNSLGRGSSARITLDFGDDTISRDEHAFIVYDNEDRSFHITHGGKANLVRLNGKAVLEARTLNAGAEVRIGATTLRFVPFCGPDFDWRDIADGA